MPEKEIKCKQKSFSPSDLSPLIRRERWNKKTEFDEETSLLFAMCFYFHLPKREKEQGSRFGRSCDCFRFMTFYRHFPVAFYRHLPISTEWNELNTTRKTDSESEPKPYRAPHKSYRQSQTNWFLRELQTLCWLTVQHSRLRLNLY